MKKFLLLIAAVVVTMTASAQSKTFAKSQVGAKVEKQKLPDFLLKAKTELPFGDFKKGLVATPKKQKIQSREGEIDESKVLDLWCWADSLWPRSKALSTCLPRQQNCAGVWLSLRICCKSILATRSTRLLSTPPPVRSPTALFG